MRLKSLCLAGATLLSLAAPAAALADPAWSHDGDYHQGWRDGGGYRQGWRDEDGWRRDEWRGREGWAQRGWYGVAAPRCVIEDRGYYNWYGDYVNRPVRVCYR